MPHASFKPRCPRCKKKFKTNARVLQHMNQPRSSCAGLTWVEELIHIDVPHADKCQRDQDPPHHHLASGFPSTDICDEEPFHDDQFMLFENNSEGVVDSSDGRVVDHYGGAAKTYGPGHTFMDRFDSDLHAKHRDANLYYPFSSRQDWEIGNFLERSSLSMSAIDEFLKLELVRMTVIKPFFAYVFLL